LMSTRPNPFLQNDVRSFIHESLVEKAWITVYGVPPGSPLECGVFCGLIPSDLVDEALGKARWDLSIGCGEPGCNGLDEVTYHRFGSPSRYEPFVIVRQFHSLKPGYPELIEEFRLFHNLYEDRRTGEFVAVPDDGTEEVVARIDSETGRVEVKRKALRQFLALKEMHLALYFDHFRYGDLAGLGVQRKEVREPLLTYDFGVNETPGSSFVLGKKLIPPLPKSKSGKWPHDGDTEEQYATFVIGVDGDGDAVENTCDPDQLANFSGANPEAPLYMTPVHFKRSVLQKYYADPGRYDVRDGRIKFGGIWILQIDNDLDDRVSVFLGDLGRDLPYQEQLYWSSFNIEPSGGIRRTSYARAILGQPSDPRRADLRFRLEFVRFNERWEAKWGWPLFLPLHSGDEHNLSTLRLPLNDSHAEFDGQVLSLAKVMVDSLNEAELAQSVRDGGGTLKNGAKGIDKLKAFFALNRFESAAHGMTDPTVEAFFSGVQWLRSMGSAHRKGTDYARVSQAFELEEKGRRAVFDGILQTATHVLEALAAHFLVEEPGELSPVPNKDLSGGDSAEA
ncbi:MAG: hypothetical protein AAFX41_06935, partial [Bacteroidota bacterium]